MAIESAYYDTCVFQESMNTTHVEHNYCKRLVDVRSICWWISYCFELSAAEATIGEYLQNFEVECARHGVTVLAVSLAQAKTAAKPHRHLRKRLLGLGLSQNDWNHLTAALASKVQHLCTVDPDFWDPANKANPKAKKPGSRAKRDIEASLPLRVRSASELCALA